MSGLFLARSKVLAQQSRQRAWKSENGTGDNRNARERASVKAIPLRSIKRPLAKTRKNDQRKVESLMQSIALIGLLEPIDVLEVEGEYYGFSGCHRFEACERLKMETIDCRVRKATRTTLKMHLM